ncbi:MAG: diguanylate cyclase [Chitinivibrionales bacterium]|nr:diguanylate cyclase [Chitinivibrionales bacterium]
MQPDLKTESSSPGQELPKETKYHVLIVDDELKICELLSAVLESSYSVTTCFCTKDALSLIDRNTFDCIVTDLKLPDGDGIDILKHARKKDDHTEIIIITAYASLDTATRAINLGASSYLTKPISVKEFKSHVEKSIAQRAFFLKSRMLMEQYSGLPCAAKEHIGHITGIYELSQKLMFSLDIKTIMKTILQEFPVKLHASIGIIGVCLDKESEIYVMTGRGNSENGQLKNILHEYWETIFSTVDSGKFSKDSTPLVFLHDGHNELQPENPGKPVVVPMIVMGSMLGCMAVFRNKDDKFSSEEQQFLHVFSSLVAPLIDNAYTHRRAVSQAATDPLTGIANHRTFHEMLSREIARTNRNKGCFCLAMLDIDDFKKINDTYGHLTGDAVLKDLSRRIEETIREGDVVARYGGEEFALILPHSNMPGAQALAQRIITSINSAPYVSYDNRFSYTVSIGLARYDGTAPQEKESLIQTADNALYESKRNGKNRLTAYN